MPGTLRSSLDACDPHVPLFSQSDGAEWSAGRVADAADRAAAFLNQQTSTGQGLGGQVVALRLHNCPEWTVLLLALLAAGCRPLLVAADAPDGDVDRLLDLADGSWLVTGLSPEGEPILSARSPLPSAPSGPPGLLIPTSGSTGQAKLIPRTEASLIREAVHYRDRFGIRPGERLAIPEPLSHSYALSWLACGLVAQATMRLGQATALGAVELSLTSGADLVCLTPTLARLLLLRRREPVRAGARLVVIGAGPVDESLASGFERSFGVGLGRVYGSTETGAICAGGAELPPRCVGAVLPGIGYRIVDEQGLPVPAGEPGCLELRLPEEPGWQPTHDLVVADGEQRLTVLGRRSAAIRRNDRWIAPGEVEDALRRHPGVKDAIVTSRVDADAGAQITAEVEIVPDGPDAAALMGFLRLHLAPYKLPNEIRVATELPRSSSGKLLSGLTARGA